MGVRDDILEAETVLPGERNEEGGDPRWQAVIQVGKYVESDPEPVWHFARKWGGHPLADLRAAVATCILEHLLEYHFAAYFPRVEQVALADPLFGDAFRLCSKFGQSTEPVNAERFDSLQERLRM